MKLSEVFDQLSYGELAQIDLGGAGIGEEHWDRLLASVNLGLTELHKRFLLKEGRVVVALQPGKTTYVLDSKYALSDVDHPTLTKYLQDSVDEPFQNDILKIERIYDSLDNELGLNNPGDLIDRARFNCRTPNYNTLVVPAELMGSQVSVVYRANHPLLRKEDSFFDPAEVEVNLPYSHLEALLYYVASRIMNPIGMTSEFHDGNNYAMKFEQACAVLEQQNFRVDSLDRFDRFNRNGWV